jgi:hypothetical protein
VAQIDNATEPCSIVAVAVFLCLATLSPLILCGFFMEGCMKGCMIRYFPPLNDDRGRTGGRAGRHHALPRGLHV